MRKQMHKKVFFNLIAGLAIMMFVSSAYAAELTDGYALLIQQSPVDAGSVTPGAGVHKFQIGETVSLAAIPKPGYRFLYWLGDVSETGRPDTTIQVDSPKLVVAVFTREAYEEELPGVRLIMGSAYGGGGGGRRIGTPMFSTGSANPGSFFYYDPGNVIINYPEEEPPPVKLTEGETFVPGEKPEEVPEPAALLLLGVGALALFKKNRN